MFGIGMPEMILILAVALIVIGPKKLPDLAKSLGRALGEFKKATSELKDSIDIGDELQEVSTSFDALKHDIGVTTEKSSAGDDPTPAATVEDVSADGESGDGVSKETESLSSKTASDDGEPGTDAKGKTVPVGSTGNE